MDVKNIKKWLSMATSIEQEHLAKAAKTSRMYLYQLSTGHRRASAEKAGIIEKASVEMSKKNRTLPVLTRMDVCAACANCPYAAKCKSKG